MGVVFGGLLRRPRMIGSGVVADNGGEAFITCCFKSLTRFKPIVAVVAIGTTIKIIEDFIE